MEYNVIELPLEEAIILVAKENFERDVRVGVEENDGPMDDIYLEEARALLEDTGENYYPEYHDHHLIRVKKG